MANVKGETLGKLATPLGWDGVDLRPIRVDATGSVSVVVKSSELPTGASTLAAQTIISNAVKKLTTYAIAEVLLSGYIANAAVGSNTIDIAGPAGTEVWLISEMNGSNYNSACTFIRLGFTRGAVSFWVAQELAPVVGQRVRWHGAVAVFPGMKMSINLQGCTLNDDLQATVVGYKMSL